MEEQKPNRGAMFTRQKKSDSHPDFGGDFTIGGDVMDYIVRCSERGEIAKLRISAWNRRTQSGAPMLTLDVQVQTDAQPQRGGYGNGQRGGAGNYQRGGNSSYGGGRGNYGGGGYSSGQGRGQGGYREGGNSYQSSRSGGEDRQPRGQQSFSGYERNDRDNDRGPRSRGYDAHGLPNDERYDD